MRKTLIQRLAFACMTLLVGWSLSAQPQVTLSGQVVDDFGEPLMGVGVIQQGTTHGVATDLDGMYSLTVPAGATVEFSYIGFKPHPTPKCSKRRWSWATVSRRNPM